MRKRSRSGSAAKTAPPFATDSRDYGDDGYWVSRHARRRSAGSAATSDETDEWLLEWAQLQPLLAEALPNNASVVDVGCGNSLLALGIGSLYNHSSRPNVDYRVHEETLTIDYFAARDVPAGEELCIYCGPDEELWFDVK